MPAEPLNEITFVARLGAVTALRAERRRQAGEVVLIESGEVEERQVDGQGRVRRCDIRLNSPTRRKLASGEMKRPEVAEGRDPRNPGLIDDARRKAIARGLPFYFTCNMAEVVLFSVAHRTGEADHEERSYALADISSSREVDANWERIAEGWSAFIDDLEIRLAAASAVRPVVTSADLLTFRDAINEIAEEAIDRVVNRVENDPALAERLRTEAANTFGFAPALKPAFRAAFRDELMQLLRFGAFVIAQKLILYRVLQDSGPRRAEPFTLDPLTLPEASTDPAAVKGVIDLAIGHAIARSGDFETAFLPNPLSEIVFHRPQTPEEETACRVGDVWHALQRVVEGASWVSISRNLVGFLYEIIVDPQFRHQLGQFYTREDVVDLLVGYGVQDLQDVVLDPAAGGGSFLRACYARKRALGENHEEALSDIWGCEITAFAAELSTITLATSDTTEPAAYPRVLLKDFFDLRPSGLADLVIPGRNELLRVPAVFDAVVGNPPYISYRRQTNQGKVLNALATLPDTIVLPRFSGKSDAYVWFIVHATQFLREGGRLAFVVSSALLFSDYGIPLIRFLGRHYKIHAVVDSMVERWFPDADTNTVLLFMERRSDRAPREANIIRFIRLRRPLAQLLPSPEDNNRREVVETFVETLLAAEAGGEDPRMTVNHVEQGPDGGLLFQSMGEERALESEEEESE